MQGCLALAKAESQWIQALTNKNKKLMERQIMDDYIQSLKKNMKAGKLGQVKTLLELLPSRPDHEKKQGLEIIALSPDKPAFELLSFLILETSHIRQDADLYDRLIQLVTDRAHLNFNFVVILLKSPDQNTAAGTTPLLKHILSNETDKDILIEIIRSAGKLRMGNMIDEIAEFIFYDDPNLKTEAIRALERIGTVRACEKLEQASKTEKCDQDILDAYEALNARIRREKTKELAPDSSEQNIQADLEMLCSADVNKRFKAFIALSEKGSELSSILAKHLKDNPDHDLTLNILRLISRTIPLEAINDLFDIISRKDIPASLKFAVYSALLSFPELESAASVIQGIFESSLPVRLSAMKVVDKNLSDFICAEIKNKIESGTKKGELLAETILDARARHVIEYMMISDTFSYMASNYLIRSAPVQVMDTFIQILEKRNLKSTARKYQDIRSEKAEREENRIIVVSSSECILDTYCKLLYSAGFPSLTFQKPQDAFETLISQKPLAVICDLFLNDMTGMNFSSEVRELYSSDEVPVIVSALQNSLDKAILKKELDGSGVTAIWEFPPKPNQLTAWIK